MADSHWRVRATPIIQAVIAEHHGEPLATIRRHLRAAFPWGPRELHPYKIWCDECRRQLLLECLPKEFSPDDLKSPSGRGVMADWWEDRGDEDRRKFLMKAHPNEGDKFDFSYRRKIERLYDEAMAVPATTEAT